MSEKLPSSKGTFTADIWKDKEFFYFQQYVNFTIETNDDPQTFVDRMNSYFDNWKDFDGLKTFSCLTILIKPKSVYDIVKLIRAYQVAHPDK